MDQIACEEFKLLLDYPIGFDEKIFECLLLPTTRDISYLYSLIEYVKTRNENVYNNFTTEKNSSLIDSSFGDESFYVKFAKSNPQMQHKKHQILEDDRGKEQEKRKEIKELKEKYNKIIQEIKHDYSKSKTSGIIQHSKKCQGCKIKKKAESMQCNIYEHILPENENLQDCIVFELCIPPIIHRLRDALYILTNKVFGFHLFQNKITSNFLIDTPIADYADAEQLKKRLVTIGSTSRQFSSSTKLHPNDSEDKFFQKNKLDLVIGDFKNKLEYNLKKDPSLKLNCIFNISDDTFYKPLQFSMKASGENENKVISKQNLCAKNFSLKEFVRFGSFRSGKLIQMKNLLASIITNELSLNKESVYLLFAQSIFEIGPLDNQEVLNNVIYPQAHLDFKDESYMNKLYQNLNSRITLNEKKWDEHIVLLNIVNIISRAISLAPSEQFKTKMCELLLKCRQIFSNWISNLEQLIDKSTIDFSAQDNLKFHLAAILVLMIFTYNLEPQYFNLVMKDQHDIKNWLITMHKILGLLILLYFKHSLIQCFKRFQAEPSQDQRCVIVEKMS